MKNYGIDERVAFIKFPAQPTSEKMNRTQRRRATKQKAKPVSKKHPELRKLERELERLTGFPELRIIKMAQEENLSVPHIQGLFKAKGIKLYVFNKWTDTDGSKWTDWYPKDPRREARGFAR